MSKNTVNKAFKPDKKTKSDKDFVSGSNLVTSRQLENALRESETKVAGRSRMPQVPA